MRVVPSDVVRLIRKLFPTLPNNQQQPFTLTVSHSVQLRAIFAMLEQVPEDLLLLSPEEFATLQLAKETIRDSLEYWQSRADRGLNSTPGFPNINPLRLLDDLLSKCPDSAASPAMGGLEFMSDSSFRESLRIDQADADRALSNGEWKGATVMAGSLLEALLLWALQQRSPQERAEAVSRITKRRVPLPRATRELDEWQLHELVEVAAELQLIRDDTTKQARLAKNFRNLIHPGRVQRLAVKCGRGEALGALAAVEQVIRDLSRPRT